MLWFFLLFFSVKDQTVNRLSHRQYVNKREWLCSKKTLFTKKGSGLELAHEQAIDYLPLL